MSKDLERIVTDLVEIDPTYRGKSDSTALDVWVPEDRTDREGMLEAAQELMLNGVRRPAQMARYLRVSTAYAATLMTEVEAAFAAGMQTFDPTMNRARAAAAANLVQEHAMRVFHSAMAENTKISALKVALAAQKQEADVLRLTGQKAGNTTVNVDNSDRRAVVQMQLEQMELEVPTDVLDQLADQLTAAASASLKKGGRR